MSNEAIIIGAAAALLILSRPQQVVVVRDRDDRIGFFGGMSVLLVGGLLLWLLFSAGGGTSSLPEHAAPASLEQSGESTGDYDPDVIQSIPPAARDTKVNVAPPLRQVVPTVVTEGYAPTENLYARNENNKIDIGPLWTLRLKICEKEEDVLALSRCFSKRSIKSLKVKNGEYWAVIYPPGNLESVAKSEKKDWKRHSKDCKKWNLHPEVIDLTDP